MFITVLLVVATSALLFGWLWNKKSNLYFAKLKLPYIPAPFLGGQLKEMILQRKSMGDVLMDIYNDPKTKSEPVVGVRFLHIHGLILRDLDIIKQVLVKDFNAFSDRHTSSDIHTDTLGALQMFLLKNPAWKSVRPKITPVFTGNKMRQLSKLVVDVGEDLNSFLGKKTKNGEIVDIKEIAALFTTDVIATCAYGVQANSLKDPKSEFRKHGKNIFEFSTRRAIEFALFFIWPQTVKFLNLKVFSQDSTKFLTDTLCDVMDQREKNKIVRNDLIDVLLGLRKKNRERTEKEIEADPVEYSDIMLVAQAAVFFTAGYETTSSAIMYALYELAKQPLIQKRLKEEIKEYLEKNNGEITYENIQELTYLNMVCKETFRMYPPLPHLDRQCVPENGKEFHTLEGISHFKIPRGFPIFIPIFAIHRDERYYPEPLLFNPERFSDENKDSIPQYAYMPFGLGPRNCIGERFGILQVKVGLINFLREHSVETCDETMKEIEFHRLAMLVAPIKKIVLRIKKD